MKNIQINNDKKEISDEKNYKMNNILKYIYVNYIQIFIVSFYTT